MLPYVNTLLDSPGILRDSLGNPAQLAAGQGGLKLRGRPNAGLLRLFSGLREIIGSADDELSWGRGALRWAA